MGRGGKGHAAGAGAGAGAGVSRKKKADKAKAKGKGHGHGHHDSSHGHHDNGGGGDDFHMPDVEMVVPDDQIELTEKELDEDVVRVLTATDPNCPANHVVYVFKDLEYKKVPPSNGDHVAWHFAMDGNVIHTSSDEAKAQRAVEQEKADAREEAARARKAADEEEVVLQGKNQFNYSDRAAQTFTSTRKHKGVETQPPETSTFGATATQWEMYDAFVTEWENTRKAGGGKLTATVADAGGDAEEDVIHSAAMGKSLKILERMVNQNAEDEIYNDFKFWEDPSDEFRSDGTLLPLWRFSDSKARRKQVTSMCWHPVYKDLFAIGYGSYDFLKQGVGMINVFSLKNTSHAEFSFTSESGIMCMDFHPVHSNLLAVGCYDGSVKVYDVTRKENTCLFASTIRTGKHTDPVWQVKWQAEDMATDLNFFSISSDGRVANWTMSKNELAMEVIMMLKLVGGAGSGGDANEETALTGLAGGCCFDFNKHSEHLFIVGTEEGKIHKCSKSYSGQYLETYEGHHMAVYSVKWNPYHPRVFLSCSADWTVKLWDHNIAKPVMSWDLTTSVGDIAWAPYSSTVFAAVTDTGRTHVFDLNANKHEQFCEQKVVKRARLTHVNFNPDDAILLVGDDRGGVNCLKLSPNLRKIDPIPKPEPVKGQPPRQPPTRRFIEVQKMDKLLGASDLKIEPTATQELQATEGGGPLPGTEAPPAEEKPKRRR